MWDNNDTSVIAYYIDVQLTIIIEMRHFQIKDTAALSSGYDCLTVVNSVFARNFGIHM